MKNLMLACIFSLTLLSFTGCADDEHHTSESSSMSMSTDNKDMHPRHHGDSH